MIAGLRVSAPPRFLVYRVCVATLVAAVSTNCGVLSPEEQLLGRFFEASRLHDTTSVARLSAVTFNPRIDGVVGDFEVVDVAEAGVSKRVTIRASVRQLEGATADKALVITMVRKGDRWFITRIASA